jgi:hypothetical protein
MIVYLQWALAVPEGWQSWDVTSNTLIRNAAKKAEPVGGEVLDQTPGWLVAANIQGVGVSGYDHVGLEHAKVGTGPSAQDRLTLTCWNDDPDDWPVGERWAQVWTFLPPAPDPAFDGATNTRQTITRYADAGGEIATKWDALKAEIPTFNYQPFTSLPMPDSRNVFHGIWVDQVTWDAHVALQSRHEWMEWIGG